MKRASVEELSAVSAESCTTLITKPIATTCIATSALMPNSAVAIGISSSEPPATPETPAAASEDTMHSSSAVAKSTGMFRV